MTSTPGPGQGAPDPSDRPGPPARRIGPYEQSLIDGKRQAEEAARRRASARRRNRVVGSVATVALLAAGGTGAWWYLQRRDVATSVPTAAAQPTSCASPTTVRVAVAPAAAPAVAAAAKALSTHSDGPCAAFSIESAEPFAVAGSLVGAGRPDAWVTDSGAWLDRAKQISGVTTRTGEPFATSAVVVAMPEGAASALGDRLDWASVLGGSTAVRVPDPSRSVVGRLALATTAGSASAAQLKTIVSRAARSGTGSVSLDGLASSSPAVGAVVTEAQLTSWNAAHTEEELTAVAPTGGTGAAEYALASLSDDATTTGLVSALDRFLHTDEAQKILVDNGFRTPDGTQPKEPSNLRGTITVASAPSDAQAASVARLWNDAAPKTQVLLAVDVSGSMLDRGEGGATLLGTVQRSTVRASAAVSPSTVASLWVYSLHVGDKADDYRPLVGYGALGEGRRLAAFDTSVAGLTKFVGGGRGLYDTIAATYDQAKAYWRPGYTNSVVVVAGGPNEDDFGISLDLLRQRLASAKDARKPVRVVVVDIGGRADADAMKRIVSVTGGQYVVASSVDDLQPALTAALGG